MLLDHHVCHQVLDVHIFAFFAVNFLAMDCVKEFHIIGDLASLEKIDQWIIGSLASVRQGNSPGL